MEPISKKKQSPYLPNIELSRYVDSRHGECFSMKLISMPTISIPTRYGSCRHGDSRYGDRISQNQFTCLPNILLSRHENGRHGEFISTKSVSMPTGYIPTIYIPTKAEMKAVGMEMITVSIPTMYML